MNNRSDNGFTGELVSTPSPPPFPKNLVHWRSYSGWKVAALCLLALFLWRFANTMYQTTIHKAEIRTAVVDKTEHRGWLKKTCIWLYRKTWQDYPEETKLKSSVENVIASARFWSFLHLLLAWCLVWMTFDWDTAKHFVFAGISISLGIIYSIWPVDSLPDFIPVAGVVDDLTVNLFGTGIGAASILEYYRKRRQRTVIERLAQDHPAAALNILLDDFHLRLGPGGIVETAEQSPPAYPEGRADAPSGSAEA